MTVSSNIAFNAALDLVDTFGPYSKDWPQAQKAAIKALEKSNPAFADHLTEMRAIEDQMSQWIEADDGVDVDEEGETGGGDNDGTEAPDQPIDINIGDIVDMDDMLAAYIERQLTDKSHDYRVFTKDLDQLVDIPTRGIHLDKIQAATASAVGPLQKDITRLIAARTQAVRLPGQRRGRVHAPNLHRVLSGDDRVFSRKQEAPALDTAITILIDCSASMQDGGYNSWSQSAMSLAIRSAYALATVLNRVGVPFEVVGYTTQVGFTPSDEYKAEAQHAHDIAPLTRWTPLSYPRFKEFHEPFSLDIQRRFANVHDNSGAIKMSGTIEGCSVEFAARRLLAQSQKRKMLIVLSDGKPGGPVFRPDPEALKRDRTKNRGIDPTSAPYQRHAAEMVQEVTKAGIDIVGVGINYAEIKSYYPHAVVINDVKEMPAQLMSVLKKFLIQ